MKKFSLTIKATMLAAVVAFGVLAYSTQATVTSLELTAPLDGEYWAGTQNITWTASATSTDTIAIALSSNGVDGNYNTLISGVAALDGTYAWYTTDVTDGTDYSVKITDGSLDYKSDAVFIVDNTTPTLTVDEGVDTGPVQTDTIRITTDDATSGVASQEYGFSADDTCDASDTYGNGFSSATDFSIAGDHTDYLCAKATDNAGNIGYALVGQLNTDNTAPGITDYTLDDAAAHSYFNPTVDNAKIDITADEAVKFTRIYICPAAVGTCDGSTDIKYFSQNSLNTTVTKQWDGNDSTPAQVVDGEYKLAVSIEDEAGNTADVELTPHNIFVDSTAPTMSGVVGTTVEGAGDTIEITFNEDVVATDGDWTNGGEVTIQSDIGTSVTLTNAAFSFDAPTNVLTVTLDEATDGEWLKNGESARVTPVASAVKDLAGNAVTTPQDDDSVSGDTSVPTVALTYDIDRQVKDADTIVITATFSEEMESTPQIAIATAGDGDLVATNMTIGTDRTEWTYNWDVPAGNDDDGTATITITGEDLAGNTISDATNTRVIDNTAPSVDSFTRPVDETVYRADTILTFAASDSGTGAGPVCTYSLNSGADVTTTCSETDLSVAGLVEGRNTIDVTVTDEAGNTDTSSTVSFVYDTDGILTVDDTPANNPDFPLIQEAIAAWVSGITTISVAEGTYAEAGQMHITQDLTIVGSGASKPVVTLASALPATRNANGAWVLVDENVTFTLENVVMDGSAFPTYVGVRSHGNTTITDVDFKNITASPSGSPYSGMAVASFGGTVVGGFGSDTHGTGAHAASHLTISGSTFENIGRVGVTIKGDTSTATIADNTYAGKGVGDWLDYAFELGAGGTATISNNTITDNLGVAASDGSTSSAIIANDYWGPGTAGTIIGNVFSNNTEAVSVGYSGTDATVVSMRHNTINANNVAGVWSSAPTVDAEMNWWGDATGPYNAASNPAGAGVSADDNTDFSPFCQDVPVYDAGTDTWSCTVVSVDPIDAFDIAFNPASGQIGHDADLTVTAKDSNGYTVVNGTTTKVTLAADRGAAFGAALLTMEADGDTATTITNDVVGLVNVTATQVGGTATGAGTIDFTNSDTTGPQVTSHTPADAATDVALAVVPQLDFSEELKASTVNSTNVQLKKYSDDSTVTATVALVEGGTRVTLTPVAPLEYGTQYYLAISGAVSDLAGNALTTVYDSSTKADHEFTTVVDNGDYDAPSYTAHTPAHGSSDISVMARPTITFDEVLDAATVNSTNVKLVKSDTDIAVSAVVSLVEGGQTVLITPDSNLENGTEYYFVITSGITDEAGNALDNPIGAADKASHKFMTASIEPIVVDEVITVSNAATADDTYLNGWHYIYKITVNTDETDLYVKFTNWLHTNLSDTVAANGNMRALFNTTDGSGMGATVGLTNADIISGFGDISSYEIGNDYTDQTTAMDITGMDTSTADGRQVQFDVFTKLPIGTVDGAYTTTYGIKAETTI